MKKIALFFAAAALWAFTFTLNSCDQAAVAPKHYIFDTTGNNIPRPPSATLVVHCFRETGQADGAATVRIFLSQDSLNKGGNFKLGADMSVDPFSGTVQWTAPVGLEHLPTASESYTRSYYVYAFRTDPNTQDYYSGQAIISGVYATKAHPFSASIVLKK